MSDRDRGGADDAPAITSKRSDVADHATGRPGGAGGDTLVGRSVTIARPPGELYAFWRDFSNLASFMDDVERVEMLDDARSHWVVKAPGGGTVEWDARIVDDREGALIAWTSETDADVENSGRIEFRDAPGGRGTIVTAVMRYDPPAGAIGRLVARFFRRDPAVQVRRNLRRFKQLMETGEIATAARNRAQRDAEKE